MNELLSRVRNGEHQQSVQNEQQADSARYLNDLNTVSPMRTTDCFRVLNDSPKWLETFVNGRTSQIQVVAAGVQQLCEELGCNERKQAPGVYSDVGRNTGLLAEIRQLLGENKNRDQNIEGLQVAVNGLVDVVHEDVRQNTEARNAASKSLFLLYYPRFANAKHKFSKRSNL
jgi:hypothetical protein